HALRRTMEKYSATCRLILICNYSSRIIEPIQSRCALFRFAPLSEKDTKKYLLNIIKKEKIVITPEGINAIIYVSEGDLRRGTNVLQSSAILGKEITEEMIYKATGKAQPVEIRKMIKLATTGAFKDSRSLLQVLLRIPGSYFWNYSLNKDYPLKMLLSKFTERQFKCLILTIKQKLR
ncbi:MAG: hypothetical protein ACTSQ3_04950, partial [Candidatus Heimdallarchaeota archaeon]